jgi:hypothetical protein
LADNTADLALYLGPDITRKQTVSTALPDLLHFTNSSP